MTRDIVRPSSFTIFTVGASRTIIRQIRASAENFGTYVFRSSKGDAAANASCVPSSPIDFFSFLPLCFSLLKFLLFCNDLVHRYSNQSAHCIVEFLFFLIGFFLIHLSRPRRCRMAQPAATIAQVPWFFPCQMPSSIS